MQSCKAAANTRAASSMMQAKSLCAGVEGYSLYATAGRRLWWIYAATLKMHAMQESYCKEEIFSSGQVSTTHCSVELGLHDMKGWSHQATELCHRICCMPCRVLRRQVVCTTACVRPGGGQAGKPCDLTGLSPSRCLLLYSGTFHLYARCWITNPRHHFCTFKHLEHLHCALYFELQPPGGMQR